MLRFSIRDLLWFTVVVALIVGHFLTLRLRSELPWQMLQDEKDARVLQVQELIGLIDRTNEQLQTLRAELAKTQH